MSEPEFVVDYQALKTLHKYIKLIDIKTTYPDNYKDMLCIFMQKVCALTQHCSEETI